MTAVVVAELPEAEGLRAIVMFDVEAEKQDPGPRKDNAAKRRASRGALPAHLQRVEVILTPEDTARARVAG